MHFAASAAANLRCVSTSERSVICMAICTFIQQSEAASRTSLLFTSAESRERLHLPCDLRRNEPGVHRPRKNLLSDCWCSCLYTSPLHVHRHTQQCQRKSTYNRRARLLSYFSLSLRVFLFFPSLALYLSPSLF